MSRQPLSDPKRELPIEQLKSKVDEYKPHKDEAAYQTFPDFRSFAERIWRKDTYPVKVAALKKAIAQKIRISAVDFDDLFGDYAQATAADFISSFPARLTRRRYLPVDHPTRYRVYLGHLNYGKTCYWKWLELGATLYFTEVMLAEVKGYVDDVDDNEGELSSIVLATEPARDYHSQLQKAVISKTVTDKGWVERTKNMRELQDHYFVEASEQKVWKDTKEAALAQCKKMTLNWSEAFNQLLKQREELVASRKALIDSVNTRQALIESDHELNLTGDAVESEHPAIVSAEVTEEPLSGGGALVASGPGQATTDIRGVYEQLERVLDEWMKDPKTWETWVITFIEHGFAPQDLLVPDCCGGYEVKSRKDLKAALEGFSADLNYASWENTDAPTRDMYKLRFEQRKYYHLFLGSVRFWIASLFDNPGPVANLLFWTRIAISESPAEITAALEVAHSGQQIGQLDEAMREKLTQYGGTLFHAYKDKPESEEYNRSRTGGSINKDDRDIELQAYGSGQ